MIYFIQPSKSADFRKINNNHNDKFNKLNWSKFSNNKVSSNSAKLFFNNNSKVNPNNKRSSDNNPELLLADLSKKQEELVIFSDKQYEKNNVIYAEGNVSVSFRGKLLKADNVIFDKSSKKISAKGNINLVFGEQKFKMSKLEFNFKDETGFLLDVKGSINSERLITDVSGNFYNSDIQKLNSLLDYQKKRSFKYSW